MNRVNFVDGMYPAGKDFNDVQTAVETADNRLTNAACGKGIISGLEVSIAGSVATVAPGMAFDGQGRAVVLTQAATVDLSTIVRPSADKVVWVAIVAGYARKAYGSVYDDNNLRHDQYLDDDFAVSFVAGVSDYQANAAKPDPGDAVALLDIMVDLATPLADCTAVAARRVTIPSLVTIKGQLSRLAISVPSNGVLSRTFAQLGLAAGVYSVWVQLKGKNTWMMRSPAVDVGEAGFDALFYHDQSGTPQAGVPQITIGSDMVVGEFTVGGFIQISADVYIRREDI